MRSSLKSHLVLEADRPLFHVFAATDIGYSTFDVAPGGDRFLVNAVSEEDATLPIYVVVR